MLSVPLQPVPNQTVRVQLANQITQINVYYKRQGLFMDVLKNELPVIQGVICENLNRIVRSAYLGYEGDFIWVDTQGDADPVYTGIGSRFYLVYLAEGELT